MTSIAALTSGADVPSARFRVRQHIEPLQDLGFTVHEYVPTISKYGFIPSWPRQLDPKYGLPLYPIWQAAKLASRVPGVVGSWQNSITWLERSLLAGLVTFEPILREPLVLDVDDAIWLTPPFGRVTARTIAKRSTIVTSGNRYLAQWFSDFAADVRIVPTAIDTQRFQPALSGEHERESFVVGWTGTSGNLPYLEAIETSLGRFLHRFADAEILVIADAPPSFRTLAAEKVRYIPWSEDREVAALSQLDVGLMPLPNNDWTRGKCSFKMLQYMACGIPVVASPVGMNAEVMAMGQVGLAASEDSEWYEALEYLYLNRTDAQGRGRNGRSIVEKHFSRIAISSQLAVIFRELA